VPADQVTAATRTSTCAYSTVASKFVTNYRVDKIREGSPRSCSIIATILELIKYLFIFSKFGEDNIFFFYNLPFGQTHCYVLMSLVIVKLVIVCNDKFVAIRF